MKSLAEIEVRRSAFPIFWGTMCVVAAVHLWMDVMLPISILGWAQQDDGLFMRQAANLLTSGWLGPFDQLTLVKGPGYPMFLALSSYAGLPITATQSLFQLASIGLVALAVGRISGSRIFGGAVFVVLTLLPAPFLPAVRRLINEQIYWPQVLIVLSLFAMTLFDPRLKARTWLSALAGVVLGWTWLTREEAVELLPALAVLVAFALAVAGRRRALSNVVTPMIVAGASFAVVLGSAMAMNYRTYGVFESTDAKSGSFGDAMHQLQSVDLGRKQYLAVPAEARHAVAEISPTFAVIDQEMRKPEFMAKWGANTCTYYHDICGDIAAGWFMWALRYVAKDVGYYRDAPTASAAFASIARDVATACRDGKLPCRAGIGVMPPLTLDMVRQAPWHFYALAMSASYSWPPVNGEPTMSDFTSPFTIEMMRDLNNPRFTGSQLWHGQRIAQGLRKLLSQTYSGLMPFVIGAGLIAFIVIGLRCIFHRQLDAMVVVALSAWIYLVSRLAILTAINVSSFPAGGYPYLEPCYFMALLAAVASIGTLTITIIGSPRRCASEEITDVVRS